MATRYFATNSLAGCSRSSTTVKESTTAGKFDNAYVTNSISIGASTEYISISAPFLDDSNAISGTFYLRFDLNWGSSAAADIILIQSTNVNAYRVRLTTGTTFQVYYWNTGSSAWVTWGSTFTLAQTTLFTITLKLILNTGFELYQGNTLLASSAVVPTNGTTTVDSFQFGSSSVNGFWSQIMCADYDIRDAHLLPAALNGNSAANTSGTGAYTDINETVLDESTAEVVTTSGGKMGQTKSAITVPNAYSLTATVTNARGRVSGGTITDGKIGLRSGSTNSSTLGKSYTSSYAPRGAIWTTDPATGLAFTETSFNNAEPYIEGA